MFEVQYRLGEQSEWRNSGYPFRVRRFARVGDALAHLARTLGRPDVMRGDAERAALLLRTRILDVQADRVIFDGQQLGAYSGAGAIERFAATVAATETREATTTG